MNKSGISANIEVVRSRRVLIVDDDEDQIFLLKALLEEAASSLEVYSVTNIHEVAEAIDKFGIDCVVADVMMPFGGGVVLLDLVRKVNKNVPVIMTSAGREDLKTDLLSLGATAFLPKYDSQQSLVKAVKELIATS